MEFVDFISLLENSDTDFNKICQFINNSVKSDPKLFITGFVDLLIRSDTFIIPKNVIKKIISILKRTQSIEQFSLIYKNKFNEIYWNLEKLSILPLIHYSYFIKDELTFDKHEETFLDLMIENINSKTIQNNLFVNGVSSALSLFLKYSKTNENIKLSKSYKDVFNKQIIETILATHLMYLVMNNEDIVPKNVQIILKMVRNCINKFDNEIVQEIAIKIPLLFDGLQQEKLILLQSYFCDNIQTQDFKTILVNKIIDLMKKGMDENNLIYLYKTFNGIGENAKFLEMSIYILRDYDGATPNLRNMIQKTIEMMFNKDKQEANDVFRKNVLSLPWDSNLKKFLFPLLIELANSDVMEDLIKISQDFKNKVFVQKCIKKISNSSLLLNLLAETIINSINNMNSFDDLLSFNLIFSNNILIPKNCLHKEITNQISRISLLFDAIIAFPKKFSQLLTNEDLEFSAESFNWELRFKFLNIYVISGLPKSNDDANLLLQALPGLLMIESPEICSKIKVLFDNLITNLHTQKNRINIDINSFLNSLLTIISHDLLPISNASKRQFCLDLCKSIWKNYPDIDNKTAKLNLLSIQKDGTSNLKNSFYSLSKYLHNIITDIMEIKKSEVIPEEFNIPKENDYNYFLELRLLLENSKIPINLNDETIEMYLAYQTENWELKSEIFLIISLLLQKMKVKDELIIKCSDTIFNYLLQTRKVGMICKSCPALEKLFDSVSKIPCCQNKLREYCKQLISIMSNFDMKQMRRSAGLPFISISLIKAQKDLYNDLMNALLFLCENTQNANEATNALNTLKAIVKENPINETIISKLLSIIFKVCDKFSSEWDVISAIDLLYVALINKIWGFFNGQTNFHSLSRQQFFNRIENSKEIIYDVLLNYKPHSKYLALQLLTIFTNGSEDSMLINILMNFSSNKSSRIRREAARVLNQTISKLSKEDFWNKIVEKIANCRTMNDLHFYLLVLYELRNDGIKTDFKFDCQTFYPQVINKLIQNINNYNINFEEQTIGELVLTLRNWKKENIPPSKLIEKLIHDFISDDENIFNISKSYSIEGMKLLSRFLQPNSIPKKYEKNILSLISKISSIELKGLMISLIQFVEDIDITKIIPELKELSFNPKEEFVPIHIGLSKIANIIYNTNGGKAIIFSLILSDIPFVRYQTLKSIGIDKTEHYFANYLVSQISEDEKLEISINWIKVIEDTFKYEQYSEPITFFVNEFYKLELCLPSFMEKYYSILKEPQTLFEMREKLISFWKIETDKLNLKLQNNLNI